VYVITAVIGLLLITSLASAQQEQKAAAERAGPDVLKAEIEALKAPQVAWREIAWKSCLIEGLKESRAQKKPVVLWIFIDRPADDGRC
jgi:hypothetical protein